MKNNIARFRLLLSKILLFIFILTLILLDHGAIVNEGISISLDVVGFILVLIGGFGRIWASLYIEGNKTGRIVSKGPYSMMRNPLYVFSLILLIGYCFAIQSIIISCVSLILFTLIYIPTIYSEEKILLNMHNEKYEEYYRQTPRFLPKFKLYKEADSSNQININIRKIRNILIEISGFIFFFGLTKLFDLLHHLEIIPTIFILY